MKKTFLKRYWLILTSVITTAAVLACAGDYGEEYGTSNFTPEVFVDTAYSPFFYSWQFYYGIGHDENHITRFNNTNTKEWSAWLGASAKPQSVDYLLNTATTAAADSAATAKTSDKKLATFLDYLRLAKKCEAFSLTTIDHWEVDTTKKNRHFNATALNKQLEQRLTTTTDPFLQQRYWFQLVRSQFFNSQPQDAIKTFDSYSTKFQPNTLYYRSLAYKAGAYYKLKNYTQANYLYSLVYSGCDELKTVAHYSFHPQDQKDWQGTLALCRNANEKATLWQMLGIFYSDPQRAIKEIYALDPRSERLDLLLSRAVNQSEQRFASFQLTHPGSSDLMPVYPDSTNRSLQTLITHIADAGNTARPWVWQLAAGYLNMLDKHYSIATSYYRKAESTVPKDPLPQAQFRLLKILNTVAGATTIDTKLEQQLLPDLNWLRNLPDDPGFRHYAAFGWLRQAMAAKYLRADQRVKAECLFTQPAFYTSNDNVEALKTFLAKPNKTPYEYFIASLSNTKSTDIFDYQAVQYCMNDRIDEAIEALKHAEPGKAQTILPGNPFNARINDCHDCDHSAAQKVKYSRTDLLKKLQQLKANITAGQDVYTNAILAGNAQYNITHYGNARVFYECLIYGSDQSEPWSIDSVFRAPLTSMATAIKYYNLALNAAQTDEQRAKAQYLLAKCERNEWYNHTVYASETNRFNDNNNRPDFTAWAGFKALSQYPKTKYYSEVLKECGYFNTYIQKTNKP